MQPATRYSPMLCVTISLALALIALVAVTGMFWLELHGRQASAALAIIAGTAAGALAGRFGEQSLRRKDDGPDRHQVDGQ